LRKLLGTYEVEAKVSKRSDLPPKSGLFQPLRDPRSRDRQELEQLGAAKCRQVPNSKPVFERPGK
jgi:hypothetical protein